MTIFYGLLILIAIVLATGLALSFHFTRRAELGETHSPGEYGLKFEQVEFKAADGLKLRGVWIPSVGSDKAVVILHGHGSSHDFDVYRAPALHEAGFSVLLFDFRAHGRSDGRMMTFGYKERQDVLGAIDFLHSRGLQHIGLLGFSYGGMTAMLTAPITTAVQAVITDGGPARLWSGATAWAVERGAPAWLGRILAWLFFSATFLRLGTNLFQYEPIRWVGKISPRPILFIHGDGDPFLPDFDDLFAAAREPKELWRLPEAGHCNASQLYPEEHTRQVIEFFTRHL